MEQPKLTTRHAETSIKEMVGHFVKFFDIPEGTELINYDYVADPTTGKVWFKLHLRDEEEQIAQS